MNPIRAEGLEMQDAGEETMVHDPASRRIHVLNATAASILRACDGTRSIPELARVISSDPGAEADTRAIVAQFCELGLVATD